MLVLIAGDVAHNQPEAPAAGDSFPHFGQLLLRRPVAEPAAVDCAIGVGAPVYVVGRNCPVIDVDDVARTGLLVDVFDHGAQVFARHL